MENVMKTKTNTVQLLIDKLTKEEFSQICEEWDSGQFDEDMRNIGLETDERNFPGKYFDADLTYKDDPDLNDDSEDPYDQDDPSPM